MNVKGFDKKLRARPTDRLLEIDIELCLSQSVIAETLVPTARQIGADFAPLVKRERCPEILPMCLLSMEGAEPTTWRKVRVRWRCLLRERNPDIGFNGHRDGNALGMGDIS